MNLYRKKNASKTLSQLVKTIREAAVGECKCMMGPIVDVISSRQKASRHFDPPEPHVSIMPMSLLNGQDARHM